MLGAGVFPSSLITVLVTKSFCPFSAHPELVLMAFRFVVISTYMISQPSQPPPISFVLSLGLSVAKQVFVCTLQLKNSVVKNAKKNKICFNSHC